jgi:hypothetical protein
VPVRDGQLGEFRSIIELERSEVHDLKPAGPRGETDRPVVGASAVIRPRRRGCPPRALRRWPPRGPGTGRR